MVLDVYMHDHRTVFRLRARGDLVQLVRRRANTIDQHRAIPAWVDSGQGEGWYPVRLMALNPHTIAWVEQVDLGDRDRFLAEHDPDQLEQIKQREAFRDAEAA